MRYRCEFRDFLNSFHIADIVDKFPVLLVPVILKHNQSEKLVLDICPLRIFTGIRREPREFHKKYRGLDKPDIPAY